MDSRSLKAGLYSPRVRPIPVDVDEPYATVSLQGASMRVSDEPFSGLPPHREQSFEPRQEMKMSNGIWEKHHSHEDEPFFGLITG
jgi:hypothetical protein